MRPLSPLAVALASALIATVSSAVTAQTVTRRDLADNYLLVDRIAMERGVPEAQRAEWNRAFDRTTLAFFGGDFPRVVRDMHDLIAKLTGDSAVASPTRQLLALRLRGSPRVLVSGRDPQVEVSAAVLYDDPANAESRTLDIRLRDLRGTELARGRLGIPAGAGAGTVIALGLDASTILNAPGRYTLEATLEGAQVPLRADVFVLAEPADDIRTRLLGEIAALPPTVDAQSRAAATARAGLIVERPSETNSAQFIANPAALADDVQREVRALAAGRNPYELRVGDQWRVILGPSGPIPVRIYAPRDVALGARMPVVIALHGAGGDENMFLEGYGAGRLRALADSLSFILVSPATTPFVRDLAGLDSTLAVLEREFVIDRGTVYLIGHSMGGAAAIQLAAGRREMVRAAAIIAGAGVAPENGQMAPTFFLAAETDLVIPAPRVRAAYEQAVRVGAVTEFALARDWGHTLVVGARLDEVVRWLFSR